MEWSSQPNQPQLILQLLSGRFPPVCLGCPVSLGAGGATAVGRAKFPLFEFEIALGQRQAPAGGERHWIAEDTREIFFAGVGFFQPPDHLFLRDGFLSRDFIIPLYAIKSSFAERFVAELLTKESQIFCSYEKVVLHSRQPASLRIEWRGKSGGLPPNERHAEQTREFG